ncbi:MAG: tetratricopeptide repeat protein [Desulfofustis sp.]
MLALLLCLLLSSCSSAVKQTDPPQLLPEELSGRSNSQDLSCAYFYFLWGTHAEYEKNYDEAIDAYQKALVCDPSAQYIKNKLPILLLNKGDVGAATGLLQENIDSDPNDTASRKLLAGILARQNRTEQAIDQYRAILAYEPDNESALLRLGILLEKSGKAREAEATLNKLIEINPSAYFGYLALARMSDSPESSEENYGQAIKLNWSNELAYEVAQFHMDQGDYEKAVTLLREVLEKDESQEQARLMIVQSLLGLDREEEAISELSLIPRFRNSPLQLSLVLAKLYVRLDKYDQAIDHLKAILAYENDSVARYLLGIIYSEREQFQESLTILEGIEPQQEEFEDAVIMRARLLTELGKSEQALQMLSGYMADGTTQKPLFFVMAASLYHERERPEKALTVLEVEAGAAVYPDNERILFEYGLQLERGDRLEEAIAVMQKLIEVNPDHAEALNFVGYSWADSDRNLEQAREYITRAMQLKPGNGYIQDSLGWVYFKLGDLERARSELVEALKALSEDPYLHDHLGDVYRALKEDTNARKAYQKAVELFDEPEQKDRVQKKIDALAR